MDWQITKFIMLSVDLGRKTCSYRKWDLMGIPCAHAISCIWLKREQPESYVSKWYSKEVYLHTYNNLIYSIRDKEDWPSSGKPPLGKPKYGRAMPGRPKRLRRLEPHEVVTHNGTKLSRKYNILLCSKCGAIGHNIRTCDRRKHEAINKVMWDFEFQHFNLIYLAWLMSCLYYFDRPNKQTVPLTEGVGSLRNPLEPEAPTNSPHQPQQAATSSPRQPQQAATSSPRQPPPATSHSKQQPQLTNHLPPP